MTPTEFQRKSRAWFEPVPGIVQAYLDPWFWTCWTEAYSLPELVENFDRLYGCNMSRKGAPIDLAVDKASGRFEADLRIFTKFVYDCVYTRLERPKKAFGREEVG